MGGEGSRTYAPGQTQAPARSPPQLTLQPRRPLGHEVAGKAGPSAQQAIGDPPPLGNPVCVAPIGSFVLDPGIANPGVPANLVTQVKVADPSGTEHGVQLQRRIDRSQLLVIYAVPLGQTFQDGGANGNSCQASPDPLAPLVEPAPGAQVFTKSGPITVHAVVATNFVQTLPNANQLVLTRDPTPDAVGAGSVVLLWTDAGTVLLEGGLQLELGADPSTADTIGGALAELTAGAFGGTAVGEAVLSASSQHVVPAMASYLELQSIRATRDQYEDGTVADVLKKRADYRAWLESQLRAQLDDDRTAWEATQPIATNQSIRDQRWQAHVDATISASLRAIAPTMLHVVGKDAAGDVDMDADEQPAETAPEPTDTATPGTAIDLTDVEWEPDPDSMAIVYGQSGQIVPVSQRGLVFRPAGLIPPKATGPTHVPELRPKGGVGLGPHVPRSVRPWIAIGAIGKEGMVLVRTANGLGFLIDAGGPKFFALDTLGRVTSELGVTSIARLGITHMHGDHTKSLVEFVKANNIRAVDLVFSRSWSHSPEIQELIALAKEGHPTFDAQLKALGYGEVSFQTHGGIDVTAPGAPQTNHVQITVGDTPISIYTRTDANRAMATAQAGGKSGGAHVDSAAFMYVFGHENGPNRTAVVGDLRGEDITELSRGLPPGEFKVAMKGVTTVVGFGHHFGTAAGQTPDEIRGMNELLEATLVQNGELKIVVQSSAKNSFGAGQTPTTAGREGALLNYLRRQGVEVIFAGEGTGTKSGSTVTGSTGTGQLDTNGRFSSQRSGVGVISQVDPKLAAIQRRLRLLREAHRLLDEHPEVAKEALGLQGDTGALKAGFAQDITKLENGMRELRGNASADLLDLRAVPTDATKPAFTTPAARARFRAEQATTRTDEQIVAEMETKGDAERLLTDEVMRNLESSTSAGRSLALDLEFKNIPTEVAGALDKLPKEQQDALKKKYNELTELTSALEGDRVPADKRAEVVLRVTELRDQLRALPDKPPAMTEEVERLDRVVKRLTSDAQSEVIIGRNAEGHATRTQYLKFNEPLAKGVHAIGRGMGGLMVIHSISETVSDLGHAMSGDFTLPQGIFNFTHAAYGLNLGVRMARTTFSQAMAGKGPGNVEFAILALLEVGAAATGNYKSSEERNAAVLGAGVHASVDLICAVVGQKVVEASIAAPIHPVAKILGIGLGFAIMLAGPKLIGWLGLDDWLERKMDWLPDHLHDLVKGIDAGMKSYRELIGTAQLADRSVEDLRALGVKNPEDAHLRAEVVRSAPEVAAHDQEEKVMKLFEAAYPEARDSFVGLQVLDQQATEFMHLRQNAFSGHEDMAARGAMEKRWQDIDAGLAIGDTYDTTQWTKLDDKFDELDKVLADSPPDQDKVLDAFGKIQAIVGNARYRLDPTNGGQRDPLRTQGLIKDGPGRETYRGKLELAEKRLAGYQTVLNDLSYGVTDVEAARNATDVSPAAQLRQLRDARARYDAVVDATAARHPELAGDEIWADARVLIPKLEAAARTDRAGYARVKYLEIGLQLATDQAMSSLTLATTAPPAIMKQAIEQEVTGAREAMQQRKHGHGLVFVDELDEVRATVMSQQQKEMATAIDMATQHDAPGGKKVTPLSAEEIEAARSGKLGDDNKDLSSTEQQLAEVQKWSAEWRLLVPDVDALKEWSYLGRVMPKLAKLQNPYITQTKFLITSWGSDNEYDGNLQPIVAVGSTELGRLMWTSVYPVNADARKVLGNQVTRVSMRSLQGLSPDEFVTAAQKGHKP